MVVPVKDNTIQILQDGLGQTVSIHRATLALNSRRFFDEPNGETEGSTEEVSCFEKNSTEA